MRKIGLQQRVQFNGDVFYALRIHTPLLLSEIKNGRATKGISRVKYFHIQQNFKRMEKKGLMNFFRR